MKCCGIEFHVLAVKYYPIEELGDYEDPKKEVRFCPFCGKKLS